MADNFIDVESFWTPWEHQVCNDCYSNNPYAIWLAKVGCFQPHRHLQCEYIRVVIDSEDMVLEPVRPMPINFGSFSIPYEMCKNFVNGTCHRNYNCSYAHCRYEVDMWNIKKRLARGKQRFIYNWPLIN